MDRIKLVAMPRGKRAPKVRIEKVFAAHSNCQRFVGLTRERRLRSLLFRLLLRCATDILGRAAREETVRQAKLDLIRVSNCVNVIEANDPIEIIDAGDSPVDDVRLDQVSKKE